MHHAIGVADFTANDRKERCYEYTARFNAFVEAQLGVRHAIISSSCAGALRIGTAAERIGPGDVVIMAANNWITTPVRIFCLRARPVFLAIGPRDGASAQTWPKQLLSHDGRCRRLAVQQSF